MERPRRSEDDDDVVAPATKTTGRTGRTHGEIPAISPATKPMST